MKKQRVFFCGLTILICLCIAMPVFASGGQQGGAAPGGVNPNFNLKGYPVVKEKITVRSAVVNGSNMDIPRVTWTKLEELTNIKVDFFGIETAQQAAFMAAGDWPDFFHNNLAAAFIMDYGILGNRFVDYNKMTDLMPYMVQAFKEVPGSRKIMTETNGAIYQLPVYGGGVTSPLARAYYRKDHLAKYNLPVPRTIDEFYNTLVALKKATGNPPFVIDIGYMESWFFPSFGEYIDPGFDSNAQGRVIFNRTSDQYRRYLSFINKLYSEGLLHKEFLTLDMTTKLALLRQGITTFTGNEMQNTALADFPSGNWDIGVPRPYTSQWNSNPKLKRTPVYSVAGMAMNANSRYKNEIARLLDIGFATSEVAPGTGLYGDAFCYGPEGVTWHFTKPDKSEFGFIVPPNVNKPPTVYQYENVIYTNWGRVTATINCITSEKSNNRARQLEFLENLIPFSRDDFFPISYLRFVENEQSVLDNRFTDINAYCTEMRAKFMTGVNNVNNDAEWNSYVKTINDMGIADVLKVYQASYDRWLAK